MAQGRCWAKWNLGLSYPEHLGAAGWAYALSGRFAILHGYTLGVLHFFFRSAFHTVGFHRFTSFRFMRLKPHVLQNRVKWEDMEKIREY